MNYAQITIVLVIAAGGGLLIAAGPPAESSSDDLIAQANAAFQRGEAEEADRLYVAAEERTTDPGLVAFNRAAALFQMGKYREAELGYRCVIEDGACPAERKARARYNRGTCLLRRGGSAAVYRLSIADFEACLLSPVNDEPLKADARHNLELAKILWNEARKTSSRPEVPNPDPPPDENSGNPLAKPSGTDPQPGMPEPGEGNTGGANVKAAAPQPLPQQADGKNNPGNHGDPGTASGLQPLQDTSTPQPLSPEDTREHLRRAAERIKKEKRDLLKTLYGPERPGLLDW